MSVSGSDSPDSAPFRRSLRRHFETVLSPAQATELAADLDEPVVVPVSAAASRSARDRKNRYQFDLCAVKQPLAFVLLEYNEFRARDHPACATQSGAAPRSS